MPRTKKGSKNIIKTIGPKIQSIEKETQKEENRVNPLYYYPNGYISVSALQAFESCPASFFARYYCKIDFPQTDRMALGAKFQSALNKKYEGADYAGIIDSISAEHRDTAKDLIGKALDFDRIVSLDKEYIADFGIGIPVKFIPDILIENDDKFIVVENKYSSGYYNEKMVQNQVQGTVYYYGVSVLFDKPVDVKYQIFNNVDKTVRLIDVKKDGVDVADMIKWMNSVLAQIKMCYDNDNWIINNHGKFQCGLKNACPIKFPNT